MHFPPPKPKPFNPKISKSSPINIPTFPSHNIDYESITDSISHIKDLVSKYNDDEVVSDEIKIKLTCPSTMAINSLKLPAKGFLCNHID